MKIEIVRTQIRLPKYLRDWLMGKAKDNSRSMNGEIVELMKQAKEKQEEKEVVT